MLQGLAKAKALKELQALVKDKASLKGLALAKALKRQNELRADLGMGKKQDNQKVYVDTLVFNQNQEILLVQRHANDDFMPNKWWIAGGKLEQGESLEQGAKRELLEETGIKLSDVSFVEKVKLHNGGISHRFTGVVDNDTPIHLQKDELQAYRWVNVNELSKFDLLGKLSDLHNLVELASEIVGFDGDVERGDKSVLNDDEIERLSQIEIDDTHDMGQGQRKGVAKKWLQDNLVGKTVRTVDGKIVHFNSADTVNHIPYNVRRNAITVMCVPHIPMIFAKGEFVGRETPNHGRVDETIQAFHLYRKWIELKNGYKVYAEVQACERENKADLFYAGYNLKTLEKKKAVFDGLPYHELHHADTVLSNTILLSKETNNPSETAYTVYDKAIFDEMQVNIDVEQTLPLRILQVLDENGNDITNEVLSEGWDGKTYDLPTTAYQLHEKPTANNRQKDNDRAVALMRELQETGRKATSEEKAILSRYTGTGGNLVGDDGLQGSAYEYYTPIEVASSMWDLLKESGFTGGAVLDPSAGTGIFKASAPKDILMHSVELSDISGQINALVNDDETHKVTISPFEKIASSTEDETFEAVMTNVPFGNVSARGENRFFDRMYQDDSLEEYFIKRSLDKLKPNGLAMFIVPTKMLDGTNYKKFRQAVLLRADLLGAYRLPNKVFDATGADVTTDIIVLKKFSRDVKDKIDSLYQNGGLKTLQQAKVLDKDIISGKYFTTYGKAYVLGEYQTGKGRFGDVVRVVNDDSLPNILKLVRKFGDSRIDYAMLDVANVDNEITLNDGDVRVIDGMTYEYHQGQWQMSAQQQTFDEMPFVDYGSLIRNDVKLADIDRYKAYLVSVGRKTPDWLDVLISISQDDNALYYWATLNAVAEALKVEKTQGYEPFYPELTKAMLNIAPSYAKNAYKTKNNSYKALYKAVAIAFNATGVSDYWRDGTGMELQSNALNHQQAYDNAVYRGLAENWQVDIDLIKQSNPDFNPLADDDFCINADGTKVTLARDYYVGNYAEFLAKIDDDIAQATDPQVKEKLLKQKAKAESMIDYTNVSAMNFSLLSTVIPIELKYRFFNEFVDSATILIDHDTEDKKLLKLDAKDITSFGNIDDLPEHNIAMRRYLLNRVFISISNGQTLNIDKRSIKDSELYGILTKKLNKYFRELNINFNAWLKAQKDYMAKLEYQFNAPENKQFPTIADGSAFDINNFNPKYDGFKQLHDYQFEEVRRLSRSFGGICGFDVGLGKAQPLTAKILTPNGWKLMGDIQVGDEVMAQDGTITRVTGVFPQGEKEIFAVKFSDGAMTHCCDEHLWLTQTEKDRKNERYSRLKGIDRVETGTVKTLSDIRQTLIYQKQKNHKIPMVEPIQFAHKAFTINPYLLGVLLGDGNLTGRRVAFCTPDNDVIERVSTIIQRDFENAIYIRVQESENRAIQHYFSRVDKNAPNPIRDELKQLGLCEKYSHEKFIPVEYLCSSIEQRIDLLHGLMDTDGYVSKDGITIQYYSTSEQMANDMIALVQSLGGIAWKKPKQGKYKKDNGEVVECKICYIVSIRMPSHINPFYLSRKKDRVKPKSKYIPVRYITEVTSVGVAQAQCISIEHSSHLYITDDYIVTHNTATALATIQNMHNIGVKKRTIIVVPNHTISKWAKDVNHVYDDMTDVLVIGSNQNQNDSADSKYYASDFALLTTEKGRQYRKILMTVEAFTQIPMREKYIHEYFGQGDETVKRAEVEKEKGDLASIGKKLNQYEGKIAYFEDMQIDSMVFDEAQLFKNGLDGGDSFDRIKGLSSKKLNQLATRALSARLKSWFVRGRNKAQYGLDDGVVLLTATPFTNSPIEVMTMLSLAIGDEKIKKLFAGTAMRNVDDFLSTFASIDSIEQQNILGETVSLDTFVGFQNVDLLKKVIHQVANIQNAKDRGLKIPEEDHVTSRVTLPDSDTAQLQKMKMFYKIAKALSKDEIGKATQAEKAFLSALPDELMAQYLDYREQVKEPDSTIGHAFSLINRMSELTLVGADMALNRHVVLDFDPKQVDIAKKVAQEFNTSKKPKPEFTTTRNYPLDDEFVTTITKTDKNTGEEKLEYKIKAQVTAEKSRLILNVDDSTMLANLMALVQKHGLNIRPKLSAKVQALIDNVKLELSTPKYQGFAKQLIFCDVLSMHHIIKQALIGECGIPSSQIAILNAQTMPNGTAGSPDTEAVQEIQDLFADNTYTIVIANKKAETGIDLQKGTQAIHHLTTGWTPDSLQQRNGRGVRQGNTQDRVTIYAYNANGTFDEYKRTLIENKSDWIDSLMDKNTEVKGTLVVSQELSEQDYEDLIEADSAEKIAEIIKQKAEREERERQERTQAKNTFIFNNMTKAKQQAKDTDFNQLAMRNMVADLNIMVDLVRSNAGGAEAKQKRVEKAKIMLNQYAGLPNDGVDKLWEMVENTAQNKKNAYNGTIKESDIKYQLFNDNVLFAEFKANRTDIHTNQYGSLGTEQREEFNQYVSQVKDDFFNADTLAFNRVRNIISSRLEMLETTKQEFLNNDDSEYSRDERQAIIENRAVVYRDELVYHGDLMKYNIGNDSYYAIAEVKNDGSVKFHRKFNGDYQYKKIAENERQQAIEYMVESDFERAKANGMKMSDNLQFSTLLPEVYNAVQEKVNVGKEEYDNEYIEVLAYQLIHQQCDRAVGKLHIYWNIFEQDDSYHQAKNAYYAPMVDLFTQDDISTDYVKVKRKDLDLFKKVWMVDNQKFYKEYLRPFLIANGYKLNAKSDVIGELNYLSKQTLTFSMISEILGMQLTKRTFTPSKEYDDYIQKLVEYKFSDVISNIDELVAHGLNAVFTTRELSDIKSLLGERSDNDPIIDQRANMLELAKSYARENPSGVEMVALKDSGSNLYHNKEKLKKIAEHYAWNREQSAWYVGFSDLQALMDTSWFDWDNFSVEIPKKYA